VLESTYPFKEIAMNRIFKFLPLLGILALVACDSGSTTGPDKPSSTDNPFKGKWQYLKYVAYENGGLDTVDYTAQYSTYLLVFYDTTGRRVLPSRPNSALDSLHYKFTSDSLYTTSYVDNFLNYQGRPYVFKGKNKDTLDFTDPDHIEILTRAN